MVFGVLNPKPNSHELCDVRVTLNRCWKLNREVFTALHVMQTRCSDENSVRLSVRHTRDP